jgi:hypothetical protein
MVKFWSELSLRRKAAPEGAPLPGRGLQRSILTAAAACGIAAAGANGALADGYKDGGCDPYKDYSCLDTYLGTGILERFFNYYALEYGHGTAPADPNAPPSRRDYWPRAAATIPPLAYSEWPAGATQYIGVTRPLSGADSPFMVATANTDFGKWMADNHLQMYGWVEGGFNLSTNPGQGKDGKFANNPVSYTYSSNAADLNQAVLYFERLPDTVQTDHIDWGFRLSGLYGNDYRYTNSYGLGSYQYNKHNLANGWDVPMEYVDIYDPFILEGFNLRIGRYISIPDIEAQLAPNNLTYTHSLTYAWDNYTNNGIVGSLQVTKNIMFQLGVDDGTETPIWHAGLKEKNLYSQAGAQSYLNANYPGFMAPATDPLYPGSTFAKDPGNQPSLVTCVQIKWNNGWDNFYPCIDGINKGDWGYNNIQWHGFTYYHRFNDQWHVDFESYYLSAHDVGNARNPVTQAIIAAGGTPFSPQYIQTNSTNLVACKSTTALTCDVWTASALMYLNYTPDALNNWSFRLEYYNDPQGWRTGVGGYDLHGTEFFDTALSWQHWLSPQIEFRPEISYWKSFEAKAFNAYNNGSTVLPGTKSEMVEFAADVTIHF